MVTNKRKAQLIIIAAFVLGIVVGASGQYLMHQSLVTQSNSSQEILTELTDRLKLSKEQRDQVEQIMLDTRLQYQELRTQLRPQYNAVRDASRKRVSDILSPEQQSLYDQWNREQDIKREQRDKVSAPTSSSGK